MPSARLLSGDETFWFAITTPLAAAYCLIAVENRHPVWAWQKMRKERAMLHAPIWMVCSASYIHGRFWFVRSPDFGACFEEAESHVLKRSVLLSIRVVSSIVLIGLREGVHHARPDFLSRTP